MMGALLRRDLGRLFPFAGSGAASLPLLFFLAVAMLYPFAVGPDANLLARTGGGVVWIAALLAAILPLDRLVQEDINLGMFDQLKLRGASEELVMTARLLAHWLSFGPLLVLATFPAAALLSLEGETLRLVVPRPIGRHAGAGRYRVDDRRADRKSTRWSGPLRPAADPARAADPDLRSRSARPRRRRQHRLCRGDQPGSCGDCALRSRRRDQGCAGKLRPLIHRASTARRNLVGVRQDSAYSRVDNNKVAFVVKQRRMQTCRHYASTIPARTPGHLLRNHSIPLRAWRALARSARWRHRA